MSSKRKTGIEGFRDSDNVKLLVDDQVKKNSDAILHRNWLWSANLLTKFFKKNRQKKTFAEKLDKGIHYIDFWADRMPMLHEIILDLGVDKFIRIPSLQNPKWNEDKNFSDDTEQMILARAIFGEARNALLSDNVRIAIGWTIRNRVEDKKHRWGKTYHQVILQLKQYSAFNEFDPNRPFVEDPLHSDSIIDKKAWQNCYKIAGQVMTGIVADPTNGTNHYYSVFGNSHPSYDWATKETFVTKIDNTYFHKL